MPGYGRHSTPKKLRELELRSDVPARRSQRGEAPRRTSRDRLSADDRGLASTSAGKGGVTMKIACIPPHARLYITRRRSR
jgi:hypothetical protein